VSSRPRPLVANVFLVLFTGTPMFVDPTQGAIEFTTDSLADVAGNLAKKAAVLVDVRSEEEWNEGHVRGAVFLPVTTLCESCDAAALAKLLPAGSIVYTYCRIGMRSKVAALVLQKHGYTVRALQPGFDDLVEAGFAAETPPPPA
jgi:phage shock protein E